MKEELGSTTMEDEQEIYVHTPDTPTHWPCEFDEKKCIGCNAWVCARCRDVFMPNPVKGKPPIVLYPQECWLCGSCELHCPKEGSVRMVDMSTMADMSTIHGKIARQIGS